MMTEIKKIMMDAPRLVRSKLAAKTVHAMDMFFLSLIINALLFVAIN